MFQGPVSLWPMNLAMCAVGPVVLVFGGIFLNAVAEITARWLGWPLATHRWQRIFLLIAALGIVAGCVLQGSFLSRGLETASARWFFPPLFLLVGALAVTAFFRPGYRKVATSLAVVSFASVLSIALAYGTGCKMNLWEISSARAYVARAVPLLEAAKLRDGTYPSSLPIADLGAPPILLAGPKAYISDGRTFSFGYDNPADWLVTYYSYSSSSHEWVKDDSWLD
jgi:hypothetical protein